MRISALSACMSPARVLATSSVSIIDFSSPTAAESGKAGSSSRTAGDGCRATSEQDEDSCWSGTAELEKTRCHGAPNIAPKRKQNNRRIYYRERTRPGLHQMRAMIDVRQRLELSAGTSRTYCSLPRLAKAGFAGISRLPVSLRILLESVLRHLDGRRIREEDVEALARWQPVAVRTAEVPFVVGRVLLQDFTGVPLLVDLAAMRSAMARRGLDVAR